ncbi:hypothetical protein PFAG_02841 [Plasmodium falciparum Santa Lucia]|uniref:Plasmodium RESA N-terminal domain-containing protein n=13 Tax=Plasmodium falciparum TaxID=5833 RepID=C6S3C7_PLAF7|nr:Plasmodium exported protein (PHISTc), unknown function [Plasmodium falciparum 3D7]ETW18338.1 hypothetical protein PFFVO_02854 [Plasmodium falciparum Vietnam Oak-Knoll (FVO)]ETW30675.1 hypothetical protein PFFCH_01863 [Plasmodium falciparum FCH/4]ETW36358.1 hypothetical protein PFTANZ_02910 [Plasmodium falciparum Tanzania (2000708)]ETW42733.1 hypothetical protein PFNF135_03005 [Plasmodium falciparum NF135/5.C10]ETW49153.1 hypothetical protein PFMALIP_02855 [Plasmodium falciparum MaliPS096_E1|eukprot:XP_002585404.1 Plasmodium exported protein (PHISTc), unknown function [Plasmodium falciparum 3D7]
MERSKNKFPVFDEKYIHRDVEKNIGKNNFPMYIYIMLICLIFSILQDDGNYDDIMKDPIIFTHMKKSRILSEYQCIENYNFEEKDENFSNDDIFKNDEKSEYNYSGNVVEDFNFYMDKMNETDDKWIIEKKNIKNDICIKNDPYNKLIFGDTSPDLSESEFNEFINNLDDYVNKNEMYIIWNYVNSKEKFKYLNMQQNIKSYCENLAYNYDIPKDIERNEWLKAYYYMTDILLINENKFHNYFYHLISYGKCDKNFFLEVIDIHINSWRNIRRSMNNLWTKKLNDTFKNHPYVTKK